MFKIMTKRLLRYFKENLSRYIALLILTIACITLVSTLICVSYTIKDGRTNNKELENNENGEFTLLVPMPESDIEAIENKYNCMIEEMFSYDVNCGTFNLRIFKNRQKIDKVILKEGTLPNNINEVVVEQGFAKASGYNIGDSITIIDKQYKVCGYGSICDYTLPSYKITDLSTDHVSFSWAIVHDDLYNELLDEYDYERTYTYSYVIDEDKEQKLLDDVSALEFNLDAYLESNETFNEYINDLTKSKAKDYGVYELLDKIDDIDDGLDLVFDNVNSSVKSVKQAFINIDERLDFISNNQTLPVDDADIQYINDNLTVISNALTYIQSIDFNNYGNVVDEIYQYLNVLLSLVKEEVGEEVLNEVLSQYDVDIDSYIEEIDSISSIIKTIDSFVEIYVEEYKKLTNNLDNYYQTLDQDTFYEIKSTIFSFAFLCETIESGTDLLKENMISFSDYYSEIESTCINFIKELILESTSNLIDVLYDEKNPRIGQELKYANVYLMSGYIVGVIIIALFALIFSIITNHQIKMETQIIGSLYANGVSKTTLKIFYIVPSVLVSLLGGILGFFLGTSKLIFNFSFNTFHQITSFPFYEMSVRFPVVIFSFIAPALINFIVSLVVLNKTFKQKPLELLQGNKEKFTLKKMKLKKAKFITMYQLRQLIKESFSCILIIIGVVFSLVLLMLGVDTKIFINNAERITLDEVKYSNIYYMRYPLSTIDVDGEKIITKVLSTESYGVDINYSLIGVSLNTKYYNVTTSINEGEVVINSAVADKYRLKVNDTLKGVSSIGEEYSFKIVDICNTGALLEAYINIDIMRDMLGANSNYYNAIVSNHELDIDDKYLVSTTSIDAVCKGLKSEGKATQAFLTATIVISIVIYLVVIFLIVSMMVERNRRGVAMLKILGYNNKEVKKIYIHGIMYVIIFAIFVSIPLSKVATDLICPYVYAYMPIATFYDFPIYWHVILFFEAIVCFQAILHLQKIKLGRINPQEVLKSRN